MSGKKVLREDKIVGSQQWAVGSGQLAEKSAEGLVLSEDNIFGSWQ